MDGFWLHGRNLAVDKAVLVAAATTIAATYRQQTPDGVARIALARTITAQTAQLDVSYHGQINETLAGLFHVKSTATGTRSRSSNRSTHAPSSRRSTNRASRRRLSLNIVTAKAAVVAANTPAAEILMLPDDTKRVRFEPTPPLPTYLVAFTVGPFDVRPGPRCRSPACGRYHCAALAQRVVDRSSSTRSPTHPTSSRGSTDYFAMPYPFAKLDLVAVPSQQSAMENAALITYGEYSMLLGDDAPLAQQRDYASVHTHELAHQWFGDSVTMRWWDDLWLNEAFAEFLSFKIVDEWQPGYHAAEELVQTVARGDDGRSDSRTHGASANRSSASTTSPMRSTASRIRKAPAY